MKTIQKILAVLIVLLFVMPVNTLAYVSAPQSIGNNRYVTTFADDFPTPPGGGGVGPCTETFGPYGNPGPRMDYPISFVVNPTGSNLDASTVLQKVTSASRTWDFGTPVYLFNTPTLSTTQTMVIGDEVSTITWGNLPSYLADRGAVNYVTFDRFRNKIIEFDIVMNINKGPWIVNSPYGYLNVENVALHEIGHGVGLGDLYDNVPPNVACQKEVMFSANWHYLNWGDLDGIGAEYGYCIGDLNGDGVKNFDDQVIFAAHYDGDGKINNRYYATPYGTDYLPQSDFNRDGKTDFDDFTYLGSIYTQPC